MGWQFAYVYTWCQRNQSARFVSKIVIINEWDSTARNGRDLSTDSKKVGPMRWGGQDMCNINQILRHTSTEYYCMQPKKVEQFNSILFSSHQLLRLWSRVSYEDFYVLYTVYDVLYNTPYLSMPFTRGCWCVLILLRLTWTGDIYRPIKSTLFKYSLTHLIKTSLS